MSKSNSNYSNYNASYSSNSDLQQVENFVSNIEPQPYYQAMEELQSAISNTNINVTTAELDGILDNAGLGPYTNDYEY